MRRSSREDLNRSRQRAEHFAHLERRLRLRVAKPPRRRAASRRRLMALCSGGSFLGAARDPRSTMGAALFFPRLSRHRETSDTKIDGKRHPHDTCGSYECPGANPGSPAMLAEIFMLSAEAAARSLKAMTPAGNVGRFVPIDLPVNCVDGPHSRSTTTSRQRRLGRSIGDINEQPSP